MNIDPSIRKLLDNEATIHEAQIRALFQTFDRRFGLRTRRSYGRPYGTP